MTTATHPETTEPIACPPNCEPEMWAGIVASTPPNKLHLIESVFLDELESDRAIDEIASPCPDWCTGHELMSGWDTENATGLPVRSHSGPIFGQIYAFCYEFPTTPEPFTELQIGVTDVDTVDRMAIEAAHQFNSDLAAVLAWVEDHR